MEKYTNTKVTLKDIKGFEGKYAISQTGSVYSFYKDIWMKPIDNGGGGGILV